MRAYRHEEGCANLVVQGAKCCRPRARAGAGGIQLKVKRGLQNPESSARIGCEIRPDIKFFPFTAGKSRALTPWRGTSPTVKFKRQENQNYERKT